MAVGTTAALTAGIVAMGAMTATTQIAASRSQAKSQIRAGEYNALVYEQQAGMIQEQKKLEEYQFNRAAARQRGAIIARAGGAGLLMSGSPLAVLVDTETQMQLDKNIGQYNLEVQKRFAMSGAEYTRSTGYEQARLTKFTGYTNAFSTILNTGSSAGLLNYAPMRAGKL